MDPIKRVIVDGANVMHAWPELRAFLPRQRVAARERLIARLQILHDSGLARVQVVFDGKGAEPIFESHPGNPPLIVIYSASGQTADDIIEQLVSQAKDPAICLVATADRMERQTIEAAGAHAISPEDLAAWIQRAETQRGTRISARKRANDTKWKH